MHLTLLFVMVLHSFALLVHFIVLHVLHSLYCTVFTYIELQSIITSSDIAFYRRITLHYCITSMDEHHCIVLYFHKRRSLKPSSQMHFFILIPVKRKKIITTFSFSLSLHCTFCIHCASLYLFVLHCKELLHRLILHFIAELHRLIALCYVTLHCTYFHKKHNLKPSSPTLFLIFIPIKRITLKQLFLSRFQRHRHEYAHIWRYERYHVPELSVLSRGGVTWGRVHREERRFVQRSTSCHGGRVPGMAGTTTHSHHGRAVRNSGLGSGEFMQQSAITGADYSERTAPVLTLCYGIFTDGSIFRY